MAVTFGVMWSTRNTSEWFDNLKSPKREIIQAATDHFLESLRVLDESLRRCKGYDHPQNFCDACVSVQNGETTMAFLLERLQMRL